MDQLVMLTNDGLTGFQRVGGSAGVRIVPDLAVSLPAPTDGGRSYTFQLRPGIRYSTGRLVRPDDVRWGIERSLRLGSSGGLTQIVGAQNCVAAPKRPCDLANGIETRTGSNAITFHLTAPDPDFLSELAQTQAYAVPEGTPLHPRGFVPATGPYEVASFDPKTGLRLVRNPRFHEWSQAAQPSGFPDTIVERFQGSPDAHVAAVLRGSADLAIDLSVAKPSAAILESVRTQHPSQLEDNPWISTWLLVMNARVAPFNDVRVRRALNFAVDRKRLRDLTLGQGLGPITCQVLSPGIDGYRRYCPYTIAPNKSGDWTAPDLKRARQLVRASGTTGQAVTLWIPRWIHFNAAAGNYVVSVLDSLGYKAHFRFAADPYGREDKLHLQLGFSAWGPDFVTPSSFIPPAFSCSSYNPANSQNGNTAEFCDPAIDREMTHAQSLQTSDPQAASRLWEKIDRDLTNRAPWVTFANGVALEVRSARVGNYQYNPQWGTLLDQLWVN
jgi:peptide/nickel transport system substrate-binding protein